MLKLKRHLKQGFHCLPDVGKSLKRILTTSEVSTLCRFQDNAVKN